MGTWIEIAHQRQVADLKKAVVPYVGTWIEILLLLLLFRAKNVVPYVGTWIEILSKK